MNQGIANGFQAWLDFWSARTYAYKRLRQVANHLRAPGIASTFYFWMREWETARQNAQLSAHLSREAELEQMRADVAAELEAARADFEARLVEAAEDKRRALEEQMMALSGSCRHARVCAECWAAFNEYT